MCYAAPGPRCSAHAGKLLSDARANMVKTLLKTDEADSDGIAKAAVSDLFVAQEEYNATPAGQRELQERIDQAGTDLNNILSDMIDNKIHDKEDYSDEQYKRDHKKVDDLEKRLEDLKKTKIAGESLRETKLAAWRELKRQKSLFGEDAGDDGLIHGAEHVEEDMGPVNGLVTFDENNFTFNVKGSSITLSMDEASIISYKLFEDLEEEPQVSEIRIPEINGIFSRSEALEIQKSLFFNLEKRKFQLFEIQVEADAEALFADFDDDEEEPAK